MMRNVIVVGLGFILVGGIYVSRFTFETAWTMALTAGDVFFPAKEEVKTESATASSGGEAKSAALTGFAAKFNNSLMVMDEGTPQNFDVTKLAAVKYYAFYYSASWCPPCRGFTPDLVSFYREFKPFHPEFELIFVSFDHNEEDMLNYMRSDSMHWPAVWYADIDNLELDAKKYCGAGIPCLVLVDDRGRVLSDTYQGSQYTDPHHVIDDIRSILK